MDSKALPMMSIVERSYALARERSATLKTPLAALSILFAIRFLFAPHVAPGLGMPSGLGLFGLVSIAVTIVTIAFIVGTSRMVLLSEGQTGIDYFRFDIAMWKYLGYAILFGIATGVLLGITIGIVGSIALIGPLLGLAVLVGVFAVGIRVSLFFTAIAIGAPAASLTGAWTQTQDNTLRLLGGALLTTVPAAVLSVIVTAIFGGGGLIVRLIGSLVAGPLDAATVFIGTIFVSLAYDYLVRGGSAVETQPTTAPAA